MGGCPFVVKNTSRAGKIGFIFIEQGVKVNRQEVQRPAVKARRHVPATLGFGQVVQIVDVVITAQAAVDLALMGLLDPHPDRRVLLLGQRHSGLEPLLARFVLLVNVKDESSQKWRLGAPGQIGPRSIGDDLETLKQLQQVFEDAGDQRLVVGVEQPLHHEVTVPVVQFVIVKASFGAVRRHQVGFGQSQQALVVLWVKALHFVPIVGNVVASGAHIRRHLFLVRPE